MTKKSEPVTKDDVRQIVSDVVKDEVPQIVAQIVGEIANDMLSMIAERFEKVDRRFDEVDGRFNRIENILRPTTDKVDDHEVRLKRLEVKTA